MQDCRAVCASPKPGLPVSGDHEIGVCLVQKESHNTYSTPMAQVTEEHHKGTIVKDRVSIITCFMKGTGGFKGKITPRA